MYVLNNVVLIFPCYTKNILITRMLCNLFGGVNRLCFLYGKNRIFFVKLWFELNYDIVLANSFNLVMRFFATF